MPDAPAEQGLRHGRRDALRQHPIVPVIDYGSDAYGPAGSGSPDRAAYRAAYLTGYRQVLATGHPCLAP